MLQESVSVITQHYFWNTQTRQKLDELKGSLDGVTVKQEKLAANLIQEFENKMLNSSKQLQEQLSRRQKDIERLMESKILEQGAKQAQITNDQLSEIHKKVTLL